ncbi:MAG: arsenate reductase (glutaredoxin) [Planctomycetes bacterium]|nr:arsenate reductase (glutaredoxin) [Planctomycetota bacterium]MBL7009113.1 arsenate reductase (glutaredoxin) [Planctomycetota bacterium]
MSDTLVWFNPSCSKCRAVRELLEGRGIEAEYREYLDLPPNRQELDQLRAALGLDDPAPMLRRGDSAYAELGLEGAAPGRLLDAIVAHPALLERPVVVRGGRAVIARPPERALELF